MIALSSDAMKVWPDVSGWLEAALEKTNSLLNSEDLRRAVRSGTMRLWLVQEKAVLLAAFVTEIVRGGRGGAVAIMALGGENMTRWIESFSRAMEDYAKANECRMVIEMGRAGWQRVLERLGWSDGPHVMVKVIR